MKRYDVIAKLTELRAQEDSPLSKTIYQTMKRNQKLAKELKVVLPISFYEKEVNNLYNSVDRF